jgi:NitT/TauT family transport system substrate-binding protein
MRRMETGRRAALFAAAGIALPRVAFGQAARRKVKIALAGDALHWYPAYVARAAGLFEQEGLDPEWIDVGSGTNQAASVISGSATMTPSGIEHAIEAGANGGDIVAFAMLFEMYPIQITISSAAVRRSGIEAAMPTDEKVRRLAGLTIGITSAGSGTDTMIRSVLVARGHNPDTMLRLQPVGSPAAVMAAFDRRLIDGFVLTAPYPDMAEASGAGMVAINAFRGDLPEVRGVPYTAMLTSRATIRRQPDTIAAATRALTKAITFANDKPEETQRLLHQFFRRVDPELFSRFEPAYRRAAAQNPVISQPQYDALLAWLRITKPNAPNTPYATAVETSFAQRAATELLPRRSPA